MPSPRDVPPAAAAPAPRTGLLGLLSGSARRLLKELAKFGVVGLVAFVVDVGLFNLLRFAGGEGPLYDKPLTAKAISVVVATVVAYLGNRFWTYRSRVRSGFAREYVMFFVLNGVGLLITLGCLAFSHYVLDLTSPLADNVSANVIGLGLGTAFRFWSYRRWVFVDGDADPLAQEMRQPV